LTERVFLLDGDTVTTLYTEALPLRELGEIVAAPRASDVEFNPTTGLWDVRLPSGQVVASDASREAAIRLEVAYLNEVMWNTGRPA
jgi:hypothetical protein